MADTLRIAVWLAPLVVAAVGVGVGVGLLVAAAAPVTETVIPVTFRVERALAMAEVSDDRALPPASFARFV